MFREPDWQRFHMSQTSLSHQIDEMSDPDPFDSVIREETLVHHPHLETDKTKTACHFIARFRSHKRALIRLF